MSRKTVRIRRAVTQYLRRHNGATADEALSNVTSHASAERGQRNHAALNRGHGNGPGPKRHSRSDTP